MLPKVPWNFLRNILGINVWANLYPNCGVPRWQVPIHLGPLHAIGSCGMVLELPIETLAYALTAFGLLPLLLFKLRRVRPEAGTPASRGDLLLRFTLIYGGISFVLAPLLGESLARLFDYSWPLFLVALPLLLSASGATFSSTRAAVMFLGLHLAVFWIFTQLDGIQLLGSTLAVYALGAWLLHRTWLPGSAPGTLSSPPEHPLPVL